jgi:hypothetical protein
MLLPRSLFAANTKSRSLHARILGIESVNDYRTHSPRPHAIVDRIRAGFCQLRDAQQTTRGTGVYRSVGTLFPNVEFVQRALLPRGEIALAKRFEGSIHTPFVRALLFGQ